MAPCFRANVAAPDAPHTCAAFAEINTVSSFKGMFSDVAQAASATAIGNATMTDFDMNGVSLTLNNHQLKLVGSTRQSPAATTLSWAGVAQSPRKHFL